MRRREDPALLTGEARFTDDLNIPGALHMAILRSPYAHARITSIDVQPALALPGVVAAYSGADLADAWASPMPCAWPVTEDMKNPPHHPLAIDKVCYVGDGVAVVVAESPTAARDALEAIEVVVRPAAGGHRPARTPSPTPRSSTRTSAPTSPTRGSSTSTTTRSSGPSPTPTHVVKERYVQQRLIPMAMEPRACAAVPEPFGGDITLYSATQIPHILKVMAAITLGLPEQQVRVVAPSVGGGFGSKLNVYADELLVLALAKKHGRPVRWVEERTENAQSTIHGRGQIQDIELAADADGKLLGVRVHLLADMGAYLQLVTPGIPLLGAFLYCGVYDVPAHVFSCTSVFTTMTPTDAYRGAGRPEATFAIERAMDQLAAKVGVDPAEIRRRNYIKADQFPYTAVTGLTYDSGNYEGAAKKALELADYDGRPRRAGAPARCGRHQAPRHRHLLLRRDVRPGAQPGARLAQLLGRRLGGGDRAGAAHRARSRWSPARRRTARATRRAGR